MPDCFAWSTHDFPEVRLMPPRVPCDEGWAEPATEEACFRALEQRAIEASTGDGGGPMCGYGDAGGVFDQDAACDDLAALSWSAVGGAVCVKCDDCRRGACARLDAAAPGLANSVATPVRRAEDDDDVDAASCDVRCLMVVAVFGVFGVIRPRESHALPSFLRAASADDPRGTRGGAATCPWTIRMAPAAAPRPVA